MSFACSSRLLAAIAGAFVVSGSAADVRKFRGNAEHRVIVRAVPPVSSPSSVANAVNSTGVAQANVSAVVRLKLPTSTAIPGGAVISYRTDTHSDSEAAWRSADKAQSHLEQARRSLEVSQAGADIIEKTGERIEANAAKITHLYKPDFIPAPKVVVVADVPKSSAGGLATGTLSMIFAGVLVLWNA
eukprot:TRINITY_DN850_c0_g1_i2.p1 TRINITY_DN850_c0_g1~~TRINITY_DN850_c0_g1_i2.p1  ORF type:complete len:187 (+),score=26.69 TRINITY_DN850_c0_g1_i2:55-615(+)